MSETTQITPKDAELLPPSVSSNDLLTTYEAAQYLRLSASTLNKSRVFGTGPTAIYLGRVVRYARRDLDAFVDTRRAESTTDADDRLPRRLSDALASRKANHPA